jgi:hypothetical protein
MFDHTIGGCIIGGCTCPIFIVTEYVGKELRCDERR